MEGQILQNSQLARTDTAARMPVRRRVRCGALRVHEAAGTRFARARLQADDAQVALMRGGGEASGDGGCRRIRGLRRSGRLSLALLPLRGAAVHRYQERGGGARRTDQHTRLTKSSLI